MALYRYETLTSQLMRKQSSISPKKRSTTLDGAKKLSLFVKKDKSINYEDTTPTNFEDGLQLDNSYFESILEESPVNKNKQTPLRIPRNVAQNQS